MKNGKRIERAESEYRKIVWIASYPKSGNTWARLFFEAYWLGEEFDMNDIVTSVGDDIAYNYQIGDDSDIVKLPVDIQQLARPMAMLRLVRSHNATRGDKIPLFVKTHQAHLIANGIEILPESLTKATICIIRDPKDVLPSFAKHMGFNLDTALDAMQDKHRVLGSKDARVSEFISDWRTNVNSYLNADTHNVKNYLYEDMLNDPVGQFSSMLKHAGVEPDIDRVKKAVDIVSLSKLRDREKKEGFKESSPNAKNRFFGEGGSKSRDKLTPKHIHRIERGFGQVMKRLGYLKQKAA